MATSLVSTGVTFPDATTQTTAAFPGGTRTFTTSGAVSAAGLPVALNTDGTVSTIAAVAGARIAGATVSGVTSLTNSSLQQAGVAYSTTSNVFCAIYRSSVNGIYVVAFTLSGTTFTIGTAVQVSTNTGTAAQPAICWDSVNNKFVISWGEGGTQNLIATVVTVSGTTCTLGANVTVNGTGSTTSTSIVYESSSQKVVIFINTGTAWFSYAGTVSGTTTTWGSISSQLFGSQPINTVSGGNQPFSAVAANNIILISNTSSSQVRVQPLTVSGTSMVLGTNFDISGPSALTASSLVYLPNYGLWMVGATTSNSFVTTLISSTSSTVTPVYANSASTSFTTQSTAGDVLYGSFDPQGISGIFDTTANKPVFFTKWDAGMRVIGLTLLTNVTNVTSVVADNASTWVALTNVLRPCGRSAGFGNGKVVAVGYGGSAAYEGMTTPYSTNTNFIGVSTASAAGGASLSCTIQSGVNTNVTGLTTGSTYFVSTTNTLVTNAQNGTAVKIGRALSATALLVTEGTTN